MTQKQLLQEALSPAVLTTADTAAVARAAVHLQWDPERSLRGAALNHHVIQAGTGRHLIRTVADAWIVSLTDLTSQVRKAAARKRTGHAAKAQRLFPAERVYPLPRTLNAPGSPRSCAAAAFERRGADHRGAWRVRRPRARRASHMRLPVDPAVPLPGGK